MKNKVMKENSQNAPAANKEEEKEPKTGWRKFWSDWDVVIITAVILVFFTSMRMWLVLYAYVPTGSMKPLIPINAKLLANRTAYSVGEIERGDIVIFCSEKTGLEDYLVKRVVGLPGETVKIADGQVYINGKPLEEPYTNGKTVPIDSRDEFIVPEGHYFMMGDNRGISMDSRGWADPYIAKEEIKGKVFLIFDFAEKYFRWVA
jgi:signal peptidase I